MKNSIFHVIEKDHFVTQKQRKSHVVAKHVIICTCWASLYVEQF